MPRIRIITIHVPAGHGVRRQIARRDRGFTLVEMIIAITVAGFILGAIWTGLGQMTKSRQISRARLQAYVAADSALNEIRRDIASLIRDDDLYWSHISVVDNQVDTVQGRVNRDELLIFTNRLRNIRARPYGAQGEGMEYETQYRVVQDAEGPVLWRRRDPVIDEYHDGGGIASPLLEEVSGLSIQAFDGESWYSEWNSDLLGLPFAISIEITVPVTDSPYDVPAVLRTVVAIDRIIPPFDSGEEEEEADEAADQTGDSGTGGTGPGAGSGAGIPSTSGTGGRSDT